MYPIVFDPPALEIFGLTLDLPPIYSFGTMMAIAFLVAAYLLGLELTRKGFDGELSSSLMFWAAVGGVGGARIWSIAEDLPAFFADPVAAVLTGSGFTFFGGLFGGTLAVTYAMHRHGLPWLPTADSVAPGLVLAHAIGRIGCLLAGDGDWGDVTTVPWGMAYPNAIAGWPYPPGVVVHPTPIYETIAYSIVFAILWSQRTRPMPDGTIFWGYLLLASPARFVIESLRINPHVILNLSQAQVVSIVLTIIGAIQLWRNRDRIMGPPPTRHGARA